MTKKKEDNKKESESFDLDAALSTVHRYLLPGFLEFIKDEKVTTQKQFDNLYKNYKECK